MGSLENINGNVAMTLDKLSGIRGDLVRNDSEWESWDFVKLTEALTLCTRRNPIDKTLSKINHHDAEITKADCTLHSAKMIDYVGAYIAKTRLTEPPIAPKQHRFPIESRFWLNVVCALIVLVTDTEPPSARVKEAVNTATDVIIHLSVTKMKGLRKLRKKVSKFLNFVPPTRTEKVCFLSLMCELMEFSLEP